MGSPRTEAKRCGWVEAAPGYWARGAYRVQRQTRGWRWWHVVKLDRDYPRGQASTLLAAIDAADASATPTRSASVTQSDQTPEPEGSR